MSKKCHSGRKALKKKLGLLLHCERNSFNFDLSAFMKWKFFKRNPVLLLYFNRIKKELSVAHQYCNHLSFFQYTLNTQKGSMHIQFTSSHI